MFDFMGVCYPDSKPKINKKESKPWIESSDTESHKWNPETEQWDTDSSCSEDNEMDEYVEALERRAKKSVELHKRPFDSKERKIRKENPHMPAWIARWWFYLTTLDGKREKEIAVLETSLQKKEDEKQKKKRREKLFKRLKIKKPRFK